MFLRPFLMGIAVSLNAVWTLAAAESSPAVATLRVLTYTLHHGEGVDGKLDLVRLARVITAARADVVALQEVDQKTTRTGGVDQAAELARLTGLHFAYGKAMDYQGGAYGQALLSRWPLAVGRLHRAPAPQPREGRAPHRDLRDRAPARPTRVPLRRHAP